MLCVVVLFLRNGEQRGVFLAHFSASFLLSKWKIFIFNALKGYEKKERISFRSFSLSLFYYFPNTKIPRAPLLKSLTTIFIFLFSPSSLLSSSRNRENWKRVEKIYINTFLWSERMENDFFFWKAFWVFMFCVFFFRFSHTYSYNQQPNNRKHSFD